jgi:hypothetical protein
MPIGATSEETELALDMKHQTVSPRYTELREWGYIRYWHNSGTQMKRRTHSGSDAAVHITTAKGKHAVELGMPIHKPGEGDPTAGRHKGNPLSAAAYNTRNQTPTQRLRVLQHIHKMTPVHYGT